MKRYILFLLLMALIVPAATLTGQNKEEFVVFSKKGDVQVQRNAKGSAVSLKVGDKLFTRDKIILKAGGAVTLYHTTLKKNIELKKAASTTVSSLASDLKNKKSYGDRFSNYVFDEMTASNSLFGGGKNEDMNTMGSVSRNVDNSNKNEQLGSLTGLSSSESKVTLAVADELAQSNNKLIQVKLPRSTYVIDKEIEFSWYDRQGAGVYELRIVDNNDKVIYSKKLHNTSVVLNLDEAGLGKGATYFWYVVDGDYHSNQYSFQRMADKDAEAVEDMVRDIDLEEMSSLDKMALASYYEDRNIVNRAVKIYDDVLKEYPDSPEFRKLYSRYLIRIGLIAEATKILSGSEK